ncbi:hypothetical protein AB0B27_07580 [Micromonospora rifamycinica]
MTHRRAAGGRRESFATLALGPLPAAAFAAVERLLADLRPTPAGDAPCR